MTLGSDYTYHEDGSVTMGSVTVSADGFITGGQFDRLPEHDPLRDECFYEGDWAVFDADHVEVARGSFEYCYWEHIARFDAPVGLALARVNSHYYRIFGRGGK